MAIHIAAAFGTVIGLWNTAVHCIRYRNANAFVESFTGYSPERKQWSLEHFNMLPAYAGCGVSIVASKAGANKYLPKGICF